MMLFIGGPWDGRHLDVVHGIDHVKALSQVREPHADFLPEHKPMPVCEYRRDILRISDYGFGFFRAELLDGETVFRRAIEYALGATKPKGGA